ncbi:MAG: prohibitin family protein [Chloroflexi bacterium]|nr:prohibitin family protein [Chloroflexota bacterium]
MMLTTVLTIITILLWITVALIIGITLIRQARRDGIAVALRGAFSRRTVMLIIVAVIANILARSLVFIQPQEVGVVVSLATVNGYRDRPARSGLLWLAPLVEEIYRYPISWQTYTMARTPAEGQRAGNDAIVARSSDGQEVAIDCSVIYRIIPEQAVRIHIEWQERYQEDYIRAVSRGVVRTIASNYTAEEINSAKRQNLEQAINDQLRADFQDKGFALDRFVLRNIAFSADYARAIEQKQVQQEGVRRSEYEAEQIRTLAEGRADEVRALALARADEIRVRAEAEAAARLVAANAEAEALRLIADALNGNADLLQYRYIEKLAPNVRVMLVPNDSPYILPLNELNLADLPPTAIPGTPVPATATATPAATATPVTP